MPGGPLGGGPLDIPGGPLDAPGGGFLGGATPAPRGAALPGGGCLGGATPGGAFLVAAIENGLVGGSGAGGAVVGLVVGFVVGFGKGWVGFGLTLPRAPGGGLDGGLTAVAVAGVLVGLGLGGRGGLTIAFMLALRVTTLFNAWS